MATRQTFADEIINAGHSFHEDTVIFNVLVDNLSGVGDEKLYTIAEGSIATPVFDHSFMVFYSMTSPKLSGVYFTRLGNNACRCIPYVRLLGSDFDGYGYSLNPLFATFGDDGLFTSVYKRDGYRLDDNTSNEILGLDSDFLDSFASLGFYVFSLVHKKAPVELVTPSRQVSRQVERKTGKKPSPYFEIKVDTGKTQKRYTSSQKTGRTHGAHIVRGNFATYTDEAPLFGTRTGMFWRPSHVRGEGDNIKAKNYRIVLPANQS